MVDWDDLRYVLAVVEHKSTIAAAKALGVNQSTVHRRITTLEGRLGHNLFQRLNTGYTLTEFGLTLLPALTRVEASVASVEQAVGTYTNEIKGVLRLTCPGPLAERLETSRLLELFAETYPDLKVELVMSDRYLDLGKGEADVALRSGEPEDETLVGRRIGDSAWAIYASGNYVQRHGSPQTEADLTLHSIVGYAGALANHRAAKWMNQIAPNAIIGATSDSVLGVLHAVQSGMGLAPLPTTIANMHPDLVQVLPVVEALNRGWYLLAHPDLRRAPRVNAFIEFVVAHPDLIRPVLMG